MGLQLSDVGDFVEDVFSGLGTGFEAQSQNQAATAEYNSAVAGLIKAKSAATRENSQATAKAINTAVIGLLVILGIYVISKFLIPKLR